MLSTKNKPEFSIQDSVDRPFAGQMRFVVSAAILLGCGLVQNVRGQQLNLAPLQTRLREMGISPTPSGVRQYLKDLTPSEEHNQRVARLIKQLGSGRFQARQQATRLLLKFPVPPIAALREAAEDRDLEISYRSRQLLAKIRKGDYETRLILVAGYIGYGRIPDCTRSILAIARNWNDPFVIRAFHRALSRVAIPTDAKDVEKAIADGPSIQRQVAMGALPAIYKSQKLRERLMELATDEDAAVRLTAAEQLADAGDPRCVQVFFNLLRTSGDHKRVVDDLHGVIGYQSTANLSNAQWLEWRKRNPGELPIRYPVDDAVVVHKIQRAKGRVGVIREDGELAWYAPVQHVPPGRLHVVGVELSAGPISGDLLMALRRTGHVRRVSLSGSTVNNAGLNELRDLFQLTHLNLNGCVKISDGGLQSLMRLPALEELDLSSTNVSAAGIRYLANHEYLQKLNLRRCRHIEDSAMATITNLLGLRELDIDETRVTGTGLKRLSKLDKLRVLSLGRQIDDVALASARGLPLETLRLNYSRVTANGLRHLATLKDLKVLSFYRCGLVTDDSLASLTDLTKLEDLRLTVPRMTDEGLKHLSRLRNLKRLSLYDTRISGEGLRHLNRLKQLSDLDLGRTPLNATGLENLAALTSLVKLNLRTTPVTDDGLRHLQSLPALEHLNVESTRITGSGLAALAKLKKLKELHMHNSRLTDEHAFHLAALKNLETLDVSNTQISDRALEAIGKLPRLKSLDISRTSITDKGLEQLKKVKTLRSLRVRLTGITTVGANELVKSLPNLSWSR